jgi:hypothetical protein
MVLYLYEMPGTTTTAPSNAAATGLSTNSGPHMTSTTDAGATTPTTSTPSKGGTLAVMVYQLCCKYGILKVMFGRGELQPQPHLNPDLMGIFYQDMDKKTITPSEAHQI